MSFCGASLFVGIVVIKGRRCDNEGRWDEIENLLCEKVKNTGTDLDVHYITPLMDCDEPDWDFTRAIGIGYALEGYNSFEEISEKVEKVRRFIEEHGDDEFIKGEPVVVPSIIKKSLDNWYATEEPLSDDDDEDDEDE